MDKLLRLPKLPPPPPLLKLPLPLPLTDSTPGALILFPGDIDLKFYDIILIIYSS